MKSKWGLISSIIQICIGTMAVLSFVIFAVNGENMLKWTATLVLAIAFIVLGIIGVIDYKKHK